jgi:predicted Co/Zn/Cd cation transporter (cation efflux family)
VIPGTGAFRRIYRLVSLIVFGIGATVFIGDRVLMGVQERLCVNAGYLSSRGWSEPYFFPIFYVLVWLAIFGLLLITRRMRSIVVDGWYFLIAVVAAWIGYESSREIFLPRTLISSCDPSGWSHHNELALAINALVMMPLALVSLITTIFIALHGVDEIEDRFDE